MIISFENFCSMQIKLLNLPDPKEAAGDYLKKRGYECINKIYLENLIQYCESRALKK